MKDYIKDEDCGSGAGGAGHESYNHSDIIKITGLPQNLWVGKIVDWSKSGLLVEVSRLFGLRRSIKRVV